MNKGTEQQCKEIFQEEVRTKLIDIMGINNCLKLINLFNDYFKFISLFMKGSPFKI